MKPTQQHKKPVFKRSSRKHRSGLEPARTVAGQASMDRASFLLVGVGLAGFALASLALPGCSSKTDPVASSTPLPSIEAPRLSIASSPTGFPDRNFADQDFADRNFAEQSTFHGSHFGTIRAKLSPPTLTDLDASRQRDNCKGESFGSSAQNLPGLALSLPGLAQSPPGLAQSPPGLSAESSMLASFADDSRRTVHLRFGGFEDSLNSNPFRDPSVKLVQLPAIPDIPEGFDNDEDVQAAGNGIGGNRTSEDSAVGPSASDLGPVEVVPTPMARPEYKAEEIPTPQGIPDRVMSRKTPVNPLNPVARIAADVESSKLDATGGGRPMSKTPGAPALIDPTTELGLVGTQQGPDDFRKWARPDAVLFVTGDQHGYLEPCGCTGLDKQKGGVARRFTFMQELRGMGWDLVSIDAGNQIRRIGRQAEIKLDWSANALAQMKYDAVGFGPGDMRVDPGLLLSTTMNSMDGAMFVSGNVELFQEGMIPTHKIIRKGDWAVGVSSVLDPESLESSAGADANVKELKESTQKVLQQMNADGATFRVLTFFGKDKSCEDKAKQLMADVPGFDLVVVSGSGGEPTYQPQSIPNSQTKMIVTGYKGMYAGLIGLYTGEPMKYARVALTHEFDDAPEMRTLMKDYQTQLKQLGLSELGLSTIPHFSGEKFVGSKKCGECHTTAYDIWEGSAHFDATEHLVKPPQERSDVARHFDPECLSCHVTGWNPQDYMPYESGYLDLASSEHLTGNGCENCHGPGSGHSAAEAKGSGVSEERRNSLRLAMQLPLERAKEHCMKCHDLDNSPDFHDGDAFEDEYWPEVEHYGTD